LKSTSRLSIFKSSCNN